MAQSKIKKWKAFFCAGVLLLTAICLLLAASIINYSKQDEKAHCDVAIVLGAGVADGKVSPVFRERINHGIWLYDNGYVEYLILTGGISAGNQVSDACIAKEYAISRAVPAEVIFIEETSTITEENLENAKQIMDKHALKSAIIVSDPLHMKRAMLMAVDYGINAKSSPTPTTMYQSARTKIPFLLREMFFYIGYIIVRIFR